MILDTALVACDLNKLYIDFFPIVKKAWNNIVGIKVKLLLISDTLPEYLNDYKDDVILFNPIENMSTAFQAQCIRNLYPAILKCDNAVIISDMDIIPLNKNYYVNNIEDISDDCFVSYSPALAHYKQYAMCFCAAKPNIWRDIFNINSKEDIINVLKKWWETAKVDYAISANENVGWSYDQSILYTSLHKWNIDKIIISKNIGYNRLDRLDFEDINKDKEQIKHNINNNVYSDFHLFRPYSAYKSLIDFLLSDKLDIVENYEFFSSIKSCNYIIYILGLILLFVIIYILIRLYR